MTWRASYDPSPPGQFFPQRYNSRTWPAGWRGAEPRSTPLRRLVALWNDTLSLEYQGVARCTHVADCTGVPVGLAARGASSGLCGWGYLGHASVRFDRHHMKAHLILLCMACSVFLRALGRGRGGVIMATPKTRISPLFHNSIITGNGLTWN